jgi:hypothetical protein
MCFSFASRNWLYSAGDLASLFLNLKFELLLFYSSSGGSLFGSESKLRWPKSSFLALLSFLTRDITSIKSG